MTWGAKRAGRAIGRPIGRRYALVAALLVPTVAPAACLTLASHPDGALLTQLALPDDAAAFSITYMHSVTRTPVSERYRVEGAAIISDMGRRGDSQV